MFILRLLAFIGNLLPSFGLHIYIFKGQANGRGKGYGGGPGQDRRVRSIEEVAEDMLRTLDEVKALQRGGQSHGVSQPEGAAANQV